MSKIKTHSRRLSHQNASSDRHNQSNVQNAWLVQNQNKPLSIEVSLKNSTQRTKMRPRSKQHQRNTITCNRITSQICKTERTRSDQKVHNHSEMKKYNMEVKQLGYVLGEISKQIAKELQKSKVLDSIVTLMRMELQSEPSLTDRGMTKSQQKEQQQIERQKKRIQKVLNEKNKTISQQNKLLQEIENERKIRLIYENYFYLLQKQIHNHHQTYTTLLTRTASSKFLYLMTSANDIISNGHVLTLRKDDDQQNQKHLLKNSYMCMPKIDHDNTMPEEEIEGKAKSSKLIGKKKANKKMVKIMNFIATSKALEIQEMDLYEDENHDKDKSMVRSSFKPFIMQRGTPYNQNMESLSAISIFPHSKKSILGKKTSRRHKPRSGQIISLKFIAQAREIYGAQLDSAVSNLFNIYQALGINIFAKKQIDANMVGQRVPEDYFTFDSQQLVQQSERRVEYMRRSEGNMAKCNDLLERKIERVEEDIARAEGLITEMETQAHKEKVKLYEQPDQSSQAQANQSIYHTVSHLLGVNPRNYNSQLHIQSLIHKLLQPELQSQNSVKRQSLDLSQNQQHSFDLINSHHLIQSRQSLLTFTSLVEQNGSYGKEKTKTEGHERKFTPLILTDQTLNDNNNSKIEISKTCRSIFDNGLKSLNNLFDNMNTTKSHKRVFQRSEFEKEYSKEITKKKRVMFRRQARVMPEKME